MRKIGFFLVLLIVASLVLLLPALEIVVFGMQIGKHVGVADVGIFGIPQPVPGVFDGYAMAFVAVGALLGLGRGGEACGLVHAALLTR